LLTLVSKISTTCLPPRTAGGNPDDFDQKVPAHGLSNAQAFVLHQTSRRGHVGIMSLTDANAHACLQ